MSKNMLIAQSGGPSAVINASLAGAVRTAMASDEIETVYGGRHGLEGILKRDIIDISKRIKTDADFDALASTPAMALGSCRFKLSKEVDENYETTLSIIKELGIGYFFYIGGNDSMDTVNRLSKYFAAQGNPVKCIGIPKTIDNDLAHSDHTPGFASAAKFVETTLAEISLDAQSYPMPTVIVVEIMGRNAGWLTAAAALTREQGAGHPDLIYLPEAPFDEINFVERIDKLTDEKRTVIVAASEGIKDAGGKYVAESNRGAADLFGHATLGGAGAYLEGLVLSKLADKKLKTRNIELSLLQRSAAHLVSEVDFREAIKVGEKGVEFALSGKTDVMVTIKRVSDDPYLVHYYDEPLEGVANFERTVPAEWITAGGTDVSDEMLRYLKPLVRGEHAPEFMDGIPQFFRF